MERAELLSENGKIFTVQGKALNEQAAEDVKVLVVGNPANTNCLIAMNNARDIPRERFTAMLRLDHNRAIAQLAAKLEVPVTDVTQMGVWGNHSPTMYPDLFHAQVRGEQAAAASSTTRSGSRTTSCRTSANAARRSSRRAAPPRAASAANAAIDHVHDWVIGTDGDWVSMGVPSDGSYDVPEGLISGFPCTCANGEYSIVEGLDLDDVLAREDRRLDRRADRRARHGQRAGADLGTQQKRARHCRALSYQSAVRHAEKATVAPGYAQGA